MGVRNWTALVHLITLFYCLIIPGTHSDHIHISPRHASQFISYSVLENNARTEVTIISGDGKTSFSIEMDNSAKKATGAQVFAASPGIFDKVPKFDCEGSNCPGDNRVPFNLSKDAARPKKSCPTGFRLSSSNRFCTKCTPQPFESCPSNCSNLNNKCLCCITQPV